MWIIFCRILTFTLYRIFVEFWYNDVAIKMLYKSSEICRTFCRSVREIGVT